MKKVNWGTNKAEIGSSANTLLFKRQAFSHEREVRLLLFKRESFEHDLFAYQVSPHKLIDQIMMDPRLSQKEATEFRSEIITRTGFSGAIKRSLLYAPPPEIVIPFSG